MALLALSLTSREMRDEVQTLLFRHVVILEFYKYRSPFYWAFSSPDRRTLCSKVRALDISCVAMQDVVSPLIRACPQLLTVTLQVANVEKRDCLTETLQGALSACRQIKEVRLLQPTSIRTLSVVYSLPYRLDQLRIVGLYGYQHNLWDDPAEFIDVEALALEKCKVLDWDVYYLFTLMEHSLAAGPPSSLSLASCQVDIDWIPEVSAGCLRSVRIEEAQQLLKLDHLSRFPRLSCLEISSRHDFVSLNIQLPQIHELTVIRFSENMVKLLIRWLEGGLFSRLQTLHFERDSLRQYGDVLPGEALPRRLASIIEQRNIQCTPDGVLRLDVPSETVQGRLRVMFTTATASEGKEGSAPPW